MRDASCVAFLRWALPRMGLCWRGFRRPRRQVCRRILRRCRELGLPDLEAYRERLLSDPAEWRRLAPLCRVTISRFFRDRAVFGALERTVLPALARLPRAAARGGLAAWSAGCGAGEEPYSLAILGRLSPVLAGARLRILGTDLDPVQLARARRAVYRASSLREVPEPWRAVAFAAAGEDLWRLDAGFLGGVDLELQDLAERAPPGPFQLVLCRNLAFTYFAPAAQRAVLDRIGDRLEPGGALVVGGHERLPEGAAGWEPWPGGRAIFRRI